MNQLPCSTCAPKAFPGALIVALAALAILTNDSFAQAKSAPESEAVPLLPYGVSPQESSPGRPPKPAEPLGVTESHEEPKRPPAPARRPSAKINSGPVSTAPTPASPPHNPLWDLPDAPRIGVESADALERKLHLPANGHGLASSGSITWLGIVGLLALGAVAIALTQRGKRGEDQKRRRRPERTAY